MKRSSMTTKSCASVAKRHRATIEIARSSVLLGAMEVPSSRPDRQPLPAARLGSIARDQETAMGVYGEHVLPRIVDFACNLKEAHPQRRRVCDGLAGDVVE